MFPGNSLFSLESVFNEMWFFIAEFGRAAKIMKIVIYFSKISSLVPELKRFKVTCMTRNFYLL